jgi:mRNA interferase MazF
VRRGDLYLVQKPGAHDPRKQRVFVVVSRQALIDSRFSTVICAPVYSQHDGLSTQIRAGVEEGLKKDSSVHCDELVSLQKAVLTRYIGSLGGPKVREINRALAAALSLESPASVI